MSVVIGSRGLYEKEADPLSRSGAMTDRISGRRSSIGSGVSDTVYAASDGRSSRPLAILNSMLDTLSPALARAAKYVLENPEKVVRYSLKEWSAFAKAGEASIVRLCHVAGTAGVSEFRIRVAQELALRDAAENAVSQQEPGYLDRMAEGCAHSIMDTVAAVDRAVLERVSQSLATKIRIDIFGSGVSGIIAELFSYRLLRAGLNAHAIRDPTLAHEVANGLGSQAAAVGISESGATLETVEFLKGARANGALTVAITCNVRSALARQADAVVPIAKLRLPGYGGTIATVPRAVLIAEAIAHFATQPRLRTSGQE